MFEVLCAVTLSTEILSQYCCVVTVVHNDSRPERLRNPFPPQLLPVLLDRIPGQWQVVHRLRDEPWFLFYMRPIRLCYITPHLMPCLFVNELFLSSNQSLALSFVPYVNGRTTSTCTILVWRPLIANPCRARKITSSYLRWPMNRLDLQRHSQMHRLQNPQASLRMLWRKGIFRHFSGKSTD